MARSKKCIILAGAPESDRLDWRDSALYQAGLDHSPTRPNLKHYQSSSIPSTSSFSLPIWRFVPMDGQRLRLDTDNPREHPQTPFPSFDITTLPALDESLQHSVLLHDNTQPSQLAAPDDTAIIGTTSFATDLTAISFASNLTAISFATSAASSPPQPPRGSDAPPPSPGPLTDLARIPPATHLQHLHPQTLTINLLATLLSTSPPQTIHLRHRPGGSATKQIIELLVADDTASNFRITIWLAPVAAADDLRPTLHALRPGDILLLQGIALAAFRGRVYGHSLDRRVARNRTRISTLQHGAEQGAALGPFAAKAARVRLWAASFVGPRHTAAAAAAAGLAPEPDHTRLPPDTPE